jgi:catechol-2,3-dioxygenase
MSPFLGFVKKAWATLSDVLGKWGVEMSARVRGLGHVGIFVRDLDKMVRFYRDFLGMTVTKVSERAVFLSADPDAVDHEIALFAGRPSAEDPHLIQQISMRVASFEDLQDFHRRIKAEGYPIERIVSHCSAIGCYFSDPEGNPTEVFWLTGLPSWAQVAIPIDIERPETEVLQEVREGWEKVRHLHVGERPDVETAELIRNIGVPGGPRLEPMPG